MCSSTFNVCVRHKSIYRINELFKRKYKIDICNLYTVLVKIND
jgi:hypothetical protein